MLLVIMRPWTDFGLFGFTMGIAVAVAYNLYGVHFPVWVVLVVCLMYAFKCWLDQNWLDEEEVSFVDSSYYYSYPSDWHILVSYVTVLMQTFFFSFMGFGYMSYGQQYDFPRSGFRLFVYCVFQSTMFSIIVGLMGMNVKFGILSYILFEGRVRSKVIHWKNMYDTWRSGELIGRLPI